MFIENAQATEKLTATKKRIKFPPLQKPYNTFCVRVAILITAG